jgi:hypothetical protein
MANSMFNPFIYYWMNARFRGYFKTVMSSIHMLCCDPARLLFRCPCYKTLEKDLKILGSEFSPTVCKLTMPPWIKFSSF